MTSVRLSVIHYSATGTVAALAAAIAGGSRDAGAEVRERRVAETALAAARFRGGRVAAIAGAPVRGRVAA